MYVRTHRYWLHALNIDHSLYLAIYIILLLSLTIIWYVDERIKSTVCRDGIEVRNVQCEFESS